MGCTSKNSCILYGLNIHVLVEIISYVFFVMCEKKSSSGELSQLSQIAYFKQLNLNPKISETVNDQNSNLLLMIDN